MERDLLTDITKRLKPELCSDLRVFKAYQERLQHPPFTRDENKVSHFCAYFLPFDIKKKQALLGLHKKAQTWLAPGGHVDQGEGLLRTLNREIAEELGVYNFFDNLPQPFLFTITPIDSDVQPCREHFDIWFLMPLEDISVLRDSHEFHESRWLDPRDDNNIVEDMANRLALQIVKQL